MITLHHNNQNFALREQLSAHEGQEVKTKSLQEEKAWKAAQGLEATFASQMVQQLVSENDSGIFGGGQTEVMFRSVWAEQVGQSLVGTFGIAESIYPVMLRKMESVSIKESEIMQEEQ